MDEKIEVILLDIGNTRSKSEEVKNGNFQNYKTWENLEELNSYYSIEVPFIVSSVRNFDKKIFSERAIIILDHNTKMPINLKYKTPETLGSDRIAAAVGAWSLFPNQHCLVIDIGTCITVDFIDAKSNFHGGIIAPGFMMRMKSMADYTNQLPDISQNWENIDLKLLGKSTKECLLSGSFYGIVNELNGIIDEITKDFTSINVILTGGDAHYFESRLKAPIFAGSKIVQIGLYWIWKNTAFGNN
jgi:type III pantothenate kinase